MVLLVMFNAAEAHVVVTVITDSQKIINMYITLVKCVKD